MHGNTIIVIVSLLILLPQNRHFHCGRLEFPVKNRYKKKSQLSQLTNECLS